MSRTPKIVFVYAALVFYALAPILSALIASGIASAAGARLDEGSAHPCVILGHDFGDTLYAMFVAFWLALVTLPTGCLAIVAFTIFLSVKKKQKQPPEPTLPPARPAAERH